MKIATVIQFFLPGNPCIYYGDEAGLYGYKDPFNRKCFPWEKIDEDLHSFFVILGKIHNENKFLKNAELKIIRADKDVLVFERFISEDEFDFFDKHSNKTRMIVAVNRSNRENKIEFPSIYENCVNVFDINASNDMLFGYGIVIKILLNFLIFTCYFRVSSV